MYDSSRRILGLGSLFLVLLFAVSGCYKLAPSFDETVYKGFNDVNPKLMELLVSASGGTAAETFDQREKSYNSVLGTLESLKLSLTARPVPKKMTELKVEVPSLKSLETVITTVEKMRDTDKNQGLKPLEVQAFKGSIVTSMDVILTYEGFLKD